jgi:hypothetical protein
MNIARKIEASGYIVTDKEHTVIQATGKTADEAFDSFIEAVGCLFDNDGNELSREEAMDTVIIQPATAALLEYVEENGGAGISWSHVDGIACTRDEDPELADDDDED